MDGDSPTEGWLRPRDLTEAADIQRRLAERVVVEDRFGPIARIAGADVSHSPRDPDAQIYAAAVAFDLPALVPAETAGAVAPPPLPYVPGFLGFREAPAVVAAIRKLAPAPDLLLIDGHGISHPRGLGVASHVGVLLDIPSVGVAKRILVGKIDAPLGPDPGARAPLVWKGCVVGMALRTKPRTNPVYVSVGHRVSLDAAVDWTLRLCAGYKLPEPTRRAHVAANALRRGEA